jgi:triosephosphate isomerase
MRPYIAGNWKMHGLAAQLREITGIAASVAATPSHADVLICVPPTLVFQAAQAAAGRIAIGGEDCSPEKAGAFTGDVDADMLNDAGATAVILGHSERRRIHHETDALVSAKAKAAWSSGLSTIICIGETKEQRSAGQALEICGGQLAASLPDLQAGCETSVAYEPLWAIGSGHMPAAEDVVAVHAFIRSHLVARFGDAGQAVRILYGGSVTASNAHSILGLAEVGGVLIGGASLMANDFNGILEVTRRLVERPDAAATVMQAF